MTLPWVEPILASAICGFARAITGARARWQGCAPVAGPRVYYANHASHADFVLVWACLPHDLRERTRPVAGLDYWSKDAIRRFAADRLFRSVLIDRSHAAGKDDPIRRMAAALESGDALIVFPEGTRNTTDARLLPFKSGVYHLAVACPDVEFLPVWIENLSRVMPKGRFFPVPLLCTITIGAPLRLRAHEDKETFVARTRDALLALAPPEA
ncbi:MAG: 1-acyl-sn-glycerol-3-phosphate acyltransferase [Betaproteobacteria bacterium]|nr:MAG: 1-acyl-sn-glycerol-3-phosphate acyltransferase [Betaproteobacteria bacterium]TMH65998.1 MAG: 1-acyl-sn-glycerol-3-phosphate acyltransferase [Betaproteobacteria bacterium]